MKKPTFETEEMNDLVARIEAVGKTPAARALSAELHAAALAVFWRRFFPALVALDLVFLAANLVIGTDSPSAWACLAVPAFMAVLIYPRKSRA